MKEHTKTQQKLDASRARYDTDLAEMEREAKRIDAEMRNIEQQRQEEFGEMENK